MVFNCKIFDKNGNLKKILRGNDLLSERNDFFLKQKSTKRAVNYINNLKDPKNKPKMGAKFYDKKCVFCGREFHPRQARSKYCSHECQKKIYLMKKQKIKGL